MALSLNNLNKVLRALSLIVALAPASGLPVSGASSGRKERPRRVWLINGLNPDVLRLALKAAESARNQGISEAKVLGIIDFSLPSTTRRFWVLDLEQRVVLHHELVAHGKGSGKKFATSFSNKSNSLKSSLGLFLTESTYVGGNGYSLRLRGLESGINDKAKKRSIVIHGAPYVNQTKIDELGYVGRSWGCPAVREGISKRLINTLKGGNLVFAYYPDNKWLTTSRFLNH
ncbi:MAG TPA: murein L,D-transpeptidase catalytic domain family protein [Pyrinomonadaceae bacterium]|nr:murein L,D-transpeptidase catalytic domain family protein [Pyrinomonadaceae bacterium]